MTGFESLPLKEELHTIKERVDKAITIISRELIMNKEAEPTITEAVLAYQVDVAPSAHRTAEDAVNEIIKNLDHIISIIEEETEENTDRAHEEMDMLKEWCKVEKYYLLPGEKAQSPEEYDD